MNSKAEQLKTTLRKLSSVLKGLETELLAYQMTLAAIKLVEPSAASLFDVSLGHARQSPALAAKMHEKYDTVLEQFLAQVVSEEMDVVVSTYFQEWKPTNPENLN